MLNSCRDVSQRAARTITIAERNNWLRDIALNHLTLGRAALYAAVLQGAPLRQGDACGESLDNAVDGLRRAGEQQYLPLGLLTRAWLRCLAGDPAGAQADLAEARRLIDNHGYGRRNEELEDTEAALRS